MILAIFLLPLNSEHLLRELLAWEKLQGVHFSANESSLACQLERNRRYIPVVYLRAGVERLAALNPTDCIR